MALFTKSITAVGDHRHRCLQEIRKPLYYRQKRDVDAGGVNNAQRQEAPLPLTEAEDDNESGAISAWLLLGWPNRGFCRLQSVDLWAFLNAKPHNPK